MWRRAGQQEPRGYSHGDEAALVDVGKHGVDVEAGVERNVGEQMQCAVEEGKEAQQAAKTNEPAQTRREAAHRRDGERKDEQQERGVAGGEGDVRGGIGTQGIGDRSVDKQGEGPETGDPGERFEDEDGRSFHSQRR